MSSRRSAKSHDDGGESSSVNGTGENTEEEIEISEDEESEKSSDDKKKKKPAKTCSYNKSAFSMPDDIKKLMERVLCCSCGKQLNPMNQGAVRRHPWLKVVTCKKCYKFLKSGPFTRDKDGTDEQCRWCGDGGHLYGCDFCNNCFCRSCIKRNLGRSEAAAMESEDNLDSKWKCYVCKPKKISKLVGDCSKIIEYVEKEEKKEKEREERAKLREKEKQKAKEKQREEKHKEHARNRAKNENEEKVKIEKGIKFEDTDDSNNPRRSLPAPKDKGKIVEGLKIEKKEYSSEMKDKSEVIVVDDNIQLKSTVNKVDATKGIQKVFKSGTGVNDIAANAKSKLLSQLRVEKFVGQIHKSLPVAMVNHPLATNTIYQNVSRGKKKELLPPNDMSSLNNGIGVVNVEYILDKMQKVAQSLDLLVSSILTDIAIAKLTSTNTFEAKTVAVSQIRSGMDVFFKSLSDIFNVQLVSYGHESFSVGKANDSNTLVIKPSLTKSEHKNDKDDVIEIQDSDIFIGNGESVEESMIDVIEVDMINETPVTDNEQFPKFANSKNKINKPIFVDDSVDTAVDNEYVSLSEDDTETASNEASKSDCVKENVEKVKDTVIDSHVEFILKKSLIKNKEVITEECHNAESTISPGKSHMESNCKEDMEYDSNDVENKSRDVEDENDIIDLNNSCESLPNQMESNENMMSDNVDFKKSSTKSLKEDKFKASITIKELDADPNQFCSLKKDQHDEDSEGISDGGHSKKSGKKSQHEHIAKTDEDIEVSDKIDSKKYDKASRNKNKSASHIGETSPNVDTTVGGKKSFKDASNNDKDETEGDIDLTKSQRSVKEKKKKDVREDTTCNADEDSEAISDSNDTKISAKKALTVNKCIGDLEMLDNDDSKKLSSMSQNEDNDKRKKNDVEDDSEGISVSKDSKIFHKGKKHRESKDVLDNVGDNTLNKNSKKEDACGKSGDNTEEYSEGISDSDGTRNSDINIPNENESKDIKKVVDNADLNKSSKRNQHEDKVSKICDSAEELESRQDKVNESLNTAAELELLKNLADEINESERNASEESQVSRRSTRNRGNKVIDSENANRIETLKRPSRTESQKSKQTEFYSDDENDEASSVSHGISETDKSKKSNKEKEKKNDRENAIKTAKGDEKEVPEIGADSSSGSESDDSDSSVAEMEYGRRKKRRSARHAKVEASPVRKTRSQMQDTSRSLRSASSKNSKSLSKNKKKQKLESDTDSNADVEKRVKNCSKETSQSKQKMNDDHKSSKAQKNKADKKDSKIKLSSDSDTDNADIERPTKSQFKSKQKGKDDTHTSKMQKQKDKTEDKKYSDSDTDVDADVGKHTKSQSISKKKGKDDPDSSKALKNKDKAEEKLFSDSDTDFDADLEQQIKSLSKDIKLSKRKVKEDLEMENSKKQKDKAENKKSKEKSPKGKKIILVSEDDDDETEDINDMQTSDDDDDNNDSNVEKELSRSQIETLKQAEKVTLDDSNSNDEDNDDIKLDESDDESSESEVTFPKLALSEKVKKKHKLKDDEDKSEDSDFVTPKKKARLRTKLLDAKLTDSEEEDGNGKKKGKRRKRKKSNTEEEDDTEQSEDGKKGKGKKKRRRIKKVSSSDENEKEPGADDDVGTEEEDDDGTPGGYLKRRKIRKVQGTKKLAEETKAAQKAEEERRKRIADRQKEYNSYVEVQGEEDEVEKLPDGTEQELVKSIPANDSIAEILGSPKRIPITTKCILDMDKDKKPLIEVDRKLIRKLKPHQVEAVRFIYNCCIESVERMKKDEGAGCILAHCMGLGKTLSVITFVHTMLSNQKLTKMSRCLVVCPLNTVLNWVNEFEIWLDDVDFEIEVYEMSKVKGNFQRAEMLKEWHESSSAVMIIGYDMYRNLVMGSHCRNKKQKKIFYETLAEPGPDLVVCDEGHILKNDQTTLSKSMNKIKTRRRIVLTGTPLQNNLGEYHCMVSFVKPSLLGTRKEFNNRFANPITNGQCSDSTPADVKVMKRRAHILHELLAGCVQRKDYSALTKYLPPKFEYVVSVRLSKVQMTLYEKYLEIGGLGDGGIAEVQSKGAQLFRDYQALMRIWTHPWVLKLDEIRQENKRRYSDDEDSFIDDTDSEGEDSMLSGSTSSSSSDSEKDRKSGKKNKGKNNSSDDDDKNDDGIEVVKKWTSRRRGNDQGAGSSWMEDIDMGYGQEQGPKEVTSEWWAEYVKEDDANRLELSGKLSLLFEILKMCEDIGDKVLVFSQSLLSLDIIEDFLQKIDEANNGTAVNTTADKSGAGDGKAGAGDGKTDAGSDKSGASDSKTGAGDGETDIVKVNGNILKDDENASGGGEATGDKDGIQKAKLQLSQYGKSWTKGADYFRMDGSTNSQNRKASQDMFNNPENFRARLFLISTKAGSLGINLVAANRVVIFDASWNPSHDIQSIFRVYRFGQEKPVYVYRFLAQGTMEEKIYERQVTKQSLSQRVVDEHQIERHFTASDLQELYKFQPDRLDDPNRKERLPMLPKDHMLAELMTQNKEWIVTFHEHDSLLENVVSQELNEEEKKAAWEDYENEKKGITKAVMYGGAMNSQFMGDQQMNMHNLLMMGQASLGQQAVLQIVQDLKTRFPNLPPEVFQQRVQAVLKQVLTQQIMQQTEMQRRQLELQKLNELNRLNQIKQQIQRQQAMLSGQQQQYGIRLGSLMGGLNQYGGPGGQYLPQMLNVRPPLRPMMPKQGEAMNLMTRPPVSSMGLNLPNKPPVVPMPAINKPGSQK